jgi:hypothetical protein
MTNKIYKTAQGKPVDLGTIMLQNEHVRAVGNMNVNARGDKLDQNNRVIETKPQQIQRQNARTTNVSADQVQHSTRAKRAKKEKAPVESAPIDTLIDAPVDVVPEEVISAPAPVTEDPVAVGKVLEGGVAAAISRQREANLARSGTPSGKPNEGGLAAAIARQREVKQELDKTRRQQAQAKGVRKI